MIEKDILKYIESPALLKQANIGDLKKLVGKYPFYSTAHILLLKSLKDQNSPDFEDQLYHSSVYISDRELLLNFLNTDFIDIKPETKVESETKVEAEIIQETESIEKESNQNKILKNKNVRRKINDTFEGMGENISETIMSQLKISKLKDKDKLEYSPEIYFIEEERTGENNFITIEAKPDSDFEEKSGNNDTESLLIVDNEEPFELIESEEIQTEKQSNNSNGFDISKYADEEIINNDNDLISKFIQNNPRIEVKEPQGENHDISEQSVKENSDLLSETLIKVYIKQNLFEKAIQSYQKLSLKFPEKSTYFASQIKILEEKINKQ